MKKLLVIFIFLTFYSCDFDTTEIPNKELPFFIPSSFPTPKMDHEITQEIFDLGRDLFYETRISKENKISCSICHISTKSFGINESSIAFGFDREPTLRNVLPLQNLAFYDTYLWDGSGSNLEEMLYADLTSPIFFNNDTNKIVEFLINDSIYKNKFELAYGKQTKIQAYLVSRALSDFVRCLISSNSKYDKYINGNKNVLNENELHGMNLFFSDSTNCSKCHTPPLFTDLKYHNTGVYTHYWDKGRYYFTKDELDKYKFRTPSLRNVEYTFPYLHDGKWYTLNEVINNYNNGGRYIRAKDTLIKKLNLNDNQIADLIAFLKALTDDSFLTNQNFKKQK